MDVSINSAVAEPSLYRCDSSSGEGRETRGGFLRADSDG
jgi:hypothetical protein